MIIGISSVLGAPFWFDMLGKLIQLRGSGTRPAEQEKGQVSGANSPTGGAGGVLVPSSNSIDMKGINAGSSSALSSAELELTTDQIQLIQKSGLQMPEEFVTGLLDTETRKRIVEWQGSRQFIPADGILTAAQAEQLLRGTAPTIAKPTTPTPPAALGATPLRSDGTIAPLTEQEIRDFYGDIATAPGATKGTVLVLSDGKPGKPQRVLETLIVPAALSQAIASNLRVHQRMRPHLERVLQEIVDQKLEGLVLTCAGTTVERNIGWDPDKRLSSHTWGIAIDINAEQNRQGVAPAPQGATGSVEQLVPIFNAHGFAWGGHFRNGGPDGMHFEFAVRA